MTRRFIRKFSIEFVLLFTIVNYTYSQNSDTISGKNNLKKFYIYALQGNVASIISKLDSLPNNSLNKAELTLKQKYIKRFRNQDEVFNYKTKDTFLINIIKLYHVYWNEVLLQEYPIKTANERLRKNLSKYLYENYYSAKHISEIKIIENVFEYTKKLLHKNGFYVANGNTAGFFDLLVWAKETKTVYEVGLPGKKIDVSVIFMDSIVTMGWEEYATFGRYYPGGWATKKSLYCVISDYDTTSEKFKISYLKHEGQHFADYKLYPKLSSADLEYRSKLVELSYSKESIYNLIAFFIKNSGQDRDNAHSFANYHVIKDLSKELFNADIVYDIDEWKKLSYLEINAKAKKLLLDNSKNLKKIGKKVTEFIIIPAIKYFVSRNFSILNFFMVKKTYNFLFISL